MKPRVSVIMPVYNCERYLRESIESILGQTFQDLEFLIVTESGTTKESIATIKEYSDHRIRHLRNYRKIGLARSLNRGFQNARGDYLARMDADDISRSDRINRQVEYLEKHTDVGILGTSAAIIDECGMEIERFIAPPQELIPWFLLFGEAIVHPSVMMRRSVYEAVKGYAEDVPYVEDYDLWLRAARVTRIANLPDILLEVRKHQRNVTRTYAKKHMANQITIFQREAEGILKAKIRQEALIALIAHSFERANDASDAASLVRNLCLTLAYRKGMSGSAEKAIRADAARRLNVLALLSAKHNPLTCLRVMAYALSLSSLFALSDLVKRGFDAITRKMRVTRESLFLESFEADRYLKLKETCR